MPKTAPKSKIPTSLMKTLVAIPSADVAPPPIPADKLVGEANALVALLRKHGRALQKVGIRAQRIAGLAPAAQALATAQADVVAASRSRRTKDEERAVVEATELRSDMMADARFALRADADVQAALDRIQEGDGIDDLVEDLRALTVVFGDNKAALSKIGAEPAKKAKRAAQLAAAIEHLVADRRTGDDGAGAARDLRDRAATHLFGLMADIRAAGAYVFRKQPDVLVKFRSAYNQKKVRARRAPPVVTNGQPSAPGARP